MKPLGNEYTNAKASGGDSNRLPAGGYVAVITAVEDYPLNPQTGKGDYLKIEFDICEGDYKGYYEDMNKSLGWDNGSFIRSYKPAAMGMFKGFIEAINKSNKTEFNPAEGIDEQKLVGLLFGAVIGEEEYKKNDGSIGTKMAIRYEKDIKDIRSGAYKMPTLKKLKGASAPSGFTPISDDDIPFV